MKKISMEDANAFQQRIELHQNVNYVLLILHQIHRNLHVSAKDWIPLISSKIVVLLALIKVSLIQRMNVNVSQDMFLIPIELNALKLHPKKEPFFSYH